MRVSEQVLCGVLCQGGCIRSFWRRSARLAGTPSPVVPDGLVLETPGERGDIPLCHVDFAVVAKGLGRVPAIHPGHCGNCPELFSAIDDSENQTPVLVLHHSRFHRSAGSAGLLTTLHPKGRDVLLRRTEPQPHCAVSPQFYLHSCNILFIKSESSFSCRTASIFNQR